MFTFVFQRHCEFSLKESIDNFNEGYFRDNSGAVERESIVICLAKNELCYLLTNKRTFVREQTLGPFSPHCHADITET